MDVKKLNGGGSRAAKKRRKENNTTTEIVNDKIKIKGDEKESASLKPDKKKTKYSADSLSQTAIELLESASTPSSSSSLCKKDLMKLSIKEVLALEEITEIDCPTRASTVLSIILAPYERKTFYSDYWEKRPMHCANDGDKKKAVKGLLSSKQFRNILKSQSVLYGQDITTSRMRADQMSGKDDDNEELIEAKEKDLWQQVEEGCSLRLLSPQKFHDPLWSLLSCLEFEFGHKVSCYVDFLPPGGKGFKPRFDHFDSFVLQLEGQSSWRLYSALEGNSLPRSAHEFEMSELPGVVSLEAVLRPGDCLYVPKGWIHKQENPSAEISMNLNVKTNEGCIADLLEVVMPEALSEAIERSQEMRRSLPRGFHSFMGVASSENDEDPLRTHFGGYTRTLLTGVIEAAMDMLDAAADQNAKVFLADRLPIPLTAEEESRTAAGAAGAIIFPYTLLRMIRPGVARCLVEEGMVVVYHCMDNARELHGAPLQPLEFELDDGPAIEALLMAYPEPIAVSELPHPSEELEDKVSLAQALYKEGFLLIHDEASKPDNEEEEVDDDDPF